MSFSGISAENVIIVIDDDKGEISIRKAPKFGKDVENGGISYGEALLMNTQIIGYIKILFSSKWSP